ncbi:hypothetical protein AB4Z34_24265 [Ensifer sp. 2YAB10]|uniref:hypothetical protein n=1 Tax=unclassified Ensifer TaxID=2633371 RepID=UPI003F8E14DD
MDISDVRNRAQGVADGPVSDEEVEFAREILRAEAGDIGSALYVVGYCGNPTDAPLIEAYLSNDEKDVHGDVAFKALCRYLGLAEWYRDRIVKYIFSDGDTDFLGSRLAGIQLSHDYLKRRRDSVIEARLVAIFCDLQDEDRDAARYELVKTLGLRNKLSDPFGLDRNAPDTDAPMILDEACRQFGLDLRNFTKGPAA